MTRLKLSSSVRLGLGFVLAAVALSVIVFRAYGDQSRLDDAYQWVAHTHAVAAELEALKSVLLDAEAGQRGYLITSQESYLSSYHNAVARIPQQLSRIKSLTGDNPVQQRNMSTVEAGIDLWRQQLNKDLGLQSTHSFDAAKASMLSNEGRKAMDDVHSTLSSMIKEEQRLLGRRIPIANEAVRRVHLAFTARAILNFALLGLVYWLIIRDRTGRERAYRKVQSYSGQLASQQAELEKANQFLAELATVDGLTGAKNRRACMDFIEAVAESAAGSGSPLSAILLDVDHFKQLNDNYGHPLGDDILKEVVLCLREEVREKDFLARFGGEEFCVVLPDTGEAAASAIAERLRQTIVRAPLCGHEVTASFGVATLAPGMTDFEQLISQADMALYAAKNRGRNLVMSYSEANESGLLVMHEERRR